MTRVLRKVLAVMVAVIRSVGQLPYDVAGYWRYLCFGRGTLRRAHIEEIRAIDSPSVAILACYPGQNERTLVWQLEELRKEHFDIVLVSNAVLSLRQRDIFSRYVCTIIVRPNIGRDFGAYRDGYLFLEQKGLVGELVELLFINDTIVFPIFDAGRFWRELRALPYPAVSPFENFAHGRHLQSFMFMLRGGVPGHPAVSKFWRDYKLVDTRRHAIRHGEIGFSAMLAKAGIEAGALFDIFYLYEIAAEGVRPESLMATTEILNLKAGDSIFLEDAEQRLQRLRTVLGGLYTTSNLSHSLGLFLVACGAAPLLKKDLLSRGSAEPGDLWWLKSIPAERRLAIFNELKVKKLPVEWSLRDKFESGFLQIK